MDGKRGETNTGSELRRLRKREKNHTGIGLGRAGRQAPGGSGEEAERRQREDYKAARLEQSKAKQKP